MKQVASAESIVQLYVQSERPMTITPRSRNVEWWFKTESKLCDLDERMRKRYRNESANCGTRLSLLTRSISLWRRWSDYV
jgi:hypothetical protein